MSSKKGIKKTDSFSKLNYIWINVVFHTLIIYMQIDYRRGYTYFIFC